VSLRSLACPKSTSFGSEGANSGQACVPNQLGISSLHGEPWGSLTQSTLGDSLLPEKQGERGRLRTSTTVDTETMKRAKFEGIDLGVCCQG